jgi:hypothetical protein
MNLRNISILLGAAILIALALFWLLPQKTRLLRKHGYDKTNRDLIALAKAGDPEAAKLLRDTRICIALGIIGAFIMVFGKYI